LQWQTDINFNLLQLIFRCSNVLLLGLRRLHVQLPS
jgi:hypothetical protein